MLRCNIKNKDWKQLTESLLTNHYDPAYISNYEKKNQKIITKLFPNKYLDKRLVYQDFKKIKNIRRRNYYFKL